MAMCWQWVMKSWLAVRGDVSQVVGSWRHSKQPFLVKCGCALGIKKKRFTEQRPELKNSVQRWMEDAGLAFNAERFAMSSD